MSFEDAKEIVESFKKRPLKTLLIIIVFFGIIGVSAYIWNIWNNNGGRIVQKTEGNQSPAITTDSGDVIITYRMADESIKALIEFNSQNQEIADLKNKLINIHKNEFDSLPEEAEEWASNFIKAMPLSKDILKLAEDERKKNIINDIARIPILFDYVISFVDQRIEALQKHDQNIQYEKFKEYKVFVEANKASPKTHIVRKITFPNESSITIEITSGETDNNEWIRVHPQIAFIEKTKTIRKFAKPSTNVTLRIKPHGATLGGGGLVGDIIYMEYSPTFLNDRFKENFSKSFNKLLKIVYTR